MSVITLTTDFGTRDWFVGAMKGVILSINPQARVVDLTHEIPAGDIRSGAFALAAACRYFPKGTIHVAVVDPEVGGQRRAMAIRTKRGTFVGPDNGLLSLAAGREKLRSIRLLENQRLFLDRVSRTFHGRDVFAPVAGHLSRGLRFCELGPRAGSYVQLDTPEPRIEPDKIIGEVVYIDRFGNGITNIPEALLEAPLGFTVQLTNKPPFMVHSYYSAVPAGQPVAVLGSTGYLEIAVNGENASKVIPLLPGTRVTVEPLG